jgi:ATP-dependent Lon protease
MEIIRLPGYLDTEKLAIGLRFIWPHQARRHGLDPEKISLTKEAIKEIIALFTREAGVRELDRRISRVARKLARRQSHRNKVIDKSIEICTGDLKELLGPPRYLARTKEGEEKSYGIVNGLAWTEAGGEVLDVEVAVIPGSGQIQLTGTLGDIMKESAFAAVTYARSRATRIGLNPNFHKDVDIHIHIPEGATPKDGPSAGITIATALISALTGSFAHSDIAMTGEITLRGRILPVGGIKEKVVAALREGLKKVILPSGNLVEIETLPDEILNSIEFVAVKTMDEVLIEALSPLPEFSIGLMDNEEALRTQLSQ